MPRSPLALALAALAATALAAGDAHAAANPQLSSTQLKRTYSDLDGLVAALPKSDRAASRLRALSSDVRRAIKAGRACDGSVALQSLRSQAAKASSLPAQTSANLAAAALNTEVVLLSRPSAASCGGPSAPPAEHLTTRILASSPAQLKVRIAFPTPTFSGRRGGPKAFAQLAMEGMASGSVGKPGVPLARRGFAIPRGARVSVSVPRRSSLTLRNVDLMPLQPGSDAADDPRLRTYPGAHSPLFAAPAFKQDAATYRSKSPYPAKPLATRRGGEWRGFNIASLDFAGAQYSPGARVLKVATAMDITITFTGGTGKFNTVKAMAPANRHMLGVFKAVAVNAATAIDAANLADVVARPCGEEVMVITEPSLRVAADRLAQSKRARGLSTTVFETGSAAGQAGTTADQIASFIRDRRKTACGTAASFLILFGKNVPTFARPNERDPSNTEKLAVGDFDYVTASPSFLLPVMHVGRIPVETVDEGNRAVDKIDTWEATAPADAGFAKRASVAGLFQIDDDPERETNDFIQTMETARGGMVAAGATVDRLYTKDSGATPKYFNDGTLMPSAVRNLAWNTDGGDIVSAINDGRAVVVHDDHGYTGGWGDPSFTTADIPNLVNGNELPLVFSINCSSGEFDDPSFKSFAEQLLLRDGGGAIGVVAASRMSNTWANGYVALALTDAVYPQTLPSFGSSTPITGMGEILTMGKVGLWLTFPLSYEGSDGVTGDDYVRDHWRLYNLFGDPTVQIRL